MKVLVTGGAGFIGSHIAEYFAEAGHTVRILDNLATGFIRNIPHYENIEFIQGDICDSSTVEKAVSGIDYVFHEAALVSVPLSCERPAEAFRINTLGTLKVLQACVKAGVEKFVTASSAAVYGNNPVLPKSEDMYPEPSSPYAISKLDGEYLARMFYRVRASDYLPALFQCLRPSSGPKIPICSCNPYFPGEGKGRKRSCYLWGRASESGLRAHQRCSQGKCFSP